MQNVSLFFLKYYKYFSDCLKIYISYKTKQENVGKYLF